MNNLIKTFSVVLLLVLTFSSCVKKSLEADDDTESTTENNTATAIGNDLANISDEAGRTKSISSFKTTEETMVLTSCATLKFDTLVSGNQDSITVNFGASNCNGNDGNNRRGSVLIIYTGKYKDSLTTITITPLNYFVNDNGVSGSKTIKNLGHNAQGHLVYDITENIVINKTNGKTITMNAKRQREWLTGESTLIWADDKYSITGTSSGSNSNGRSYVSTITKPLIRDMGILCRKNFISGTIQHTPDKKPTRTIDYGNGSCDNKATVTINGKVYEVTLP
jgi:hypothetical protein